MSVCCECCVLSGRGLCDELITRTQESYRLCCVVVCDLETSRVRRPWAAGPQGKKKSPLSGSLLQNVIKTYSNKWFCNTHTCQ